MGRLSPDNPDQILQTLSNDLMSPYCPGRTISSCPSPQARKLEDHILAEAKSGKSRDEIETALVGRFGEELVGYAPPPLLLYGGSFLGLVVLVFLVMMGLRWSRRTHSSASMATAGGPTQVELDRLEDALDEVDDF